MTERRNEHSAGGVILEDGRVLLILMRTLKGGKAWTFPKGHLERGETPEAAALREVSEETGWDCEIKSPLFTAQYSFLRDGVPVDKDVRWFLMRRTGGDGRPKTPEEVCGIKWLTLAEAAKELVYNSDLEIIKLLKDGSGKTHGA
jgi:8-oxo-dGTP pyrophosphatase MutT (NUDIX family)